MRKFNILIPTDFSEQAEFAFLLVQKLAQKLVADIHFLHIMDVPDTVFLDTGGKIQTCGEIDARTLEQRKAIIDRKLEQLKDLYGESVHTHLRLGHLTDGILAFAREKEMDLIAMGTKGSWGWKERFSGSETQQIARKSDIPVLSLKCDRSDLDFQNILLVHDFRDQQVSDFTLLKAIQAGFGTTLHLLHIAREGSPNEVDDLQNQMAEYARLHGLENFHLHVLPDRDVEAGVLHFTQQHDMDLICIGTHGRSGWQHIFRSSATEKLLNHVFKPILSFRLQGS
jgi:nucleotide-binding universal stress UspA family protein